MQFIASAAVVLDSYQLPSDMQKKLQPGRPRDPATDNAITEAVISLLLERGLDATTIDAVALRSGVARPTIYRRFKDKHMMVAASVEKILEEDLPAPQLGSDARENVLTMMMNTIDLLTKTPFGGIFRLVIPHLPDRSRLVALTNEIGDQRRIVFNEVLREAQASGVVSPDKDIDYLADGIMGAIYFNYLISQRILDRRYAEGLLRSICE
jgi:AcrR family transcriptional regulator